MRTSTILFRVLALVIAVVGAWLLLQSATLGEQSATAILIRSTGGMDAAKYLSLVEGAIAGYRWLGGILVAVGLYRASEGLYTVS